MEETRPVDPSDPPARVGFDAADDSGSPGDVPGPVYACPGCGASIPLVEAPANGLVECPACGAEFFAASGGEEEAESEEREREAEAARRDRETEFNANRIRQFEALRRSLVRTHSYFVIGAAGCAGLAAELVFLAVSHYARPWWVTYRVARAAGQHPPPMQWAGPLALLSAAVAACLGCGYFLGRAREATRELAVPVQADPLTPPDFSTLSDGSHRQEWRKLEQMHAGAGGEAESSESRAGSSERGIASAE